MNKDVAHSVEKLINSGFADIEPKDLFTPCFVSNDIWTYYKHLFSPTSISAVEKRNSNNLIYEYDEIIKGKELGGLVLTLTRLNLNPPRERDSSLLHISTPRALDELIKDVVYQKKLYITRYIGVRIDKHTPLMAGIDRMVLRIDDLSSKNYIKGNLSKLLYIKLHDGSILFVSYLLFDDEGSNYLRSNNIDFDEGGVPPMITATEGIV